MPVTVVALLTTFAKYFTANWFGYFMPALIGLEILLFVGTAKGGKSFEGGVVASVSSPVRRPQPPPRSELDNAEGAAEDPKKTPAKQEKANAKKAGSAEKTNKKNK